MYNAKRPTRKQHHYYSFQTQLAPNFSSPKTEISYFENNANALNMFSRYITHKTCVCHQVIANTDLSAVYTHVSWIRFTWTLFYLNKAVESCAGRVNPRGLRVPAFAGRAREPALLCVRARVELAAGAGRARVEKFFLRVNELIQLKNHKTHGYTEVVCQHCA